MNQATGLAEVVNQATGLTAGRRVARKADSPPQGDREAKHRRTRGRLHFSWMRSEVTDEDFHQKSGLDLRAVLAGRDVSASRAGASEVSLPCAGLLQSPP